MKAKIIVVTLIAALLGVATADAQSAKGFEKNLLTEKSKKHHSHIDFKRDKRNHIWSNHHAPKSFKKTFVYKHKKGDHCIAANKTHLSKYKKGYYKKTVLIAKI